MNKMSGKRSACSHDTIDQYEYQYARYIGTAQQSIDPCTGSKLSSGCHEHTNDHDYIEWLETTGKHFFGSHAFLYSLRLWKIKFPENNTINNSGNKKQAHQYSPVEMHFLKHQVSQKSTNRDTAWKPDVKLIQHGSFIVGI